MQEESILKDTIQFMAEQIHTPGSCNTGETQVPPLESREASLFKEQLGLAEERSKLAEQVLKLAEVDFKKAKEDVYEIERQWGLREWSNKETILKILADDSYTHTSSRFGELSNAPSYIKADRELMLKVIKKFGPNAVYMLKSELEKDPVFKVQADLCIEELIKENESKRPRWDGEAPIHAPLR